MTSGTVARKLSTALLGVLVLGSLLVAYSSQRAEADHEPANKVAAAGTQEQVFGPGEEVPILQERVRVSSTSDLTLSVTLECSIVTALKLGDDDDGVSDMDSAEGKIDISVTVDGKVVPVSSDDLDDPGEVTFCNTVHQQRVTDSEDGADGLDTHETYLKTKTANSFNWLALDTGFVYDDPENGNNILDIVVLAELEDTTVGADACQLGDQSCSEAVIGHRTLIAEPTNASVHESVESTDPEGGS